MKLQLPRTSALALGLLGAAVAAPTPASTMQTRYRAVVAEPDVVCRVAPADSSAAAGTLPIATEILVGRTATGESGETWIHMGSASAGGLGIPDDCWIPGSLVVSTRVGRHLPLLADRLLSATAWPSFDDLLAVHNQFTHPWYRERVEGSPVLAGRRRDLLTKAVEAAQRVGPGGRRAVDDPLVLAWIESLGPRVSYSEDRTGRGAWTMVAGVPRGDLGPPDPGRPGPATRPEGRELAIIAADVACRSRPSRTVPDHVTVLPLDFHFRAERADTSVAGEAWVRVNMWGCWVLAAHTAPGDSEGHVLTIAERLLSATADWSLENRLRVYNVLSSRNRGHRDEVEASPILGLRRLETLDVTLDGLHPMFADVRSRAWTRSLGDEVALKHEGHAWTVSDEAYLALYDRYRSDPLADDILWRYASESAWDCEGDFACSVEEGVNARLARYWTQFPGGRNIAEAIEAARLVLGYGLKSCIAARDPGGDATEARMWGWSGWGREGGEITRELLATLEEVREEDKAPLLETLGELEACAAAVG